MGIGGIAYRVRPPVLFQIHMDDLMSGVNA
jgi:hypothetical protein